MSRSPVTGMVKQFDALTLVEQEVFLDLVDPQPEPEPAKKSGKRLSKPRKGQCAACDYPKTAPIHQDPALVGHHVYQSTAKSKRASSLAGAIQGTVGKPHLGEGPVCTVCSHTEDYEDHQEPSPHYHPFAPPAQSAAKKSSRKNAATNSTANTGVETVNASAVGASGD